MKKLFTLALAMLASVGLWAEDPDVSISNFTVNDTTQYLKLYSGNNGATVAIHQNNPNALTGWQKESGESAYYFKCEASQGIAAGPAGIRISASFKIDSISLLLTANSANKEVVVGAIGWEADETTFSNIATDYAGTFPAVTASSKKIGDAKWTTLDLSKKELTTVAIAKQFKNVVVGTASKADFPSTGAQSFFLYGIKVWVAPSCTEPENALVLTSDAAAKVYVGDKITLSTTGGIPGAGIGIAGTADEPLAGLTGTTWTATAGEHTFVATQAKYNGYCAQESELVFNVLEKTPVTAVTIDGPEEGIVDFEITLTAATDVAADTIWWTDNFGTKQESLNGVFKFTPDAAGEYTYTAWAENEFNDSPVTKAHTVVVSEPVACSNIIPSTSATAALAVGDEIELDNASEGGKIVIAGMKTAGSSISYSTSGLLLGGGGADSVRVELNNYLQEGSIITIAMASNGTTERGLNLQTTGKNAVYQAKWTPSAVGEEKTFQYVVPSGSKLIGANKFLLQRNNSVFLQRVSVANCGAAIPGTIVVSSDTTLSSVTIAGVELPLSKFSEAEPDSFVYIMDDEYVTPPTIVYTKHVVITYDDDSQVAKDIEVTPDVIDDPDMPEYYWASMITIGDKQYVINIAKKSSYAAIYMNGTDTLGVQQIDATGSPTAEYINYLSSNLKLASFDGWYTDVELTDPIDPTTYTQANPSNPVNVTFYADINYYHASSINIEQWILTNGAGKGATTKTSALLSEMGSKYYASNLAWENENIELDSLSNKEGRNEPYLGLKVKSAGKMINFRLAKNSTVKVKFGAIKSTKPQVSINGGAYGAMTITDGVYTYDAETETLLSIKMMDGNAVVFKQIMIDEEIQNVVLPDYPTALDNAADEVKAVKRIENGQLFIEKNGVIYNAQGARLQ